MYYFWIFIACSLEAGALPLKACNVGDEGGFAPNVQDNNEAWMVTWFVNSCRWYWCCLVRPWTSLWRQLLSLDTVRRPESGRTVYSLAVVVEDFWAKITSWILVNFVQQESLVNFRDLGRWRLAQMSQLLSFTPQRRSIMTWTSRIQAAQQTLRSICLFMSHFSDIFRSFSLQIVSQCLSDTQLFYSRRWRKPLHSWQIITSRGWTSTPLFPLRTAIF